MIRKMLRLIEQDHITDMNTLARKMKLDRGFLKYLIILINRQGKRIYIVNDKIYMSSGRCSHCPYFKSS